MIWDYLCRIREQPRRIEFVPELVHLVYLIYLYLSELLFSLDRIRVLY